MEDLNTVGAMINMALRTNDENRRFTRIPMHAKVTIVTEGETIEGELENLCLNGAFIKSDKRLTINSSAILNIYDNTTARTVTGLEVKVISFTTNGIGFQFMKTIF